MKTDVKQIDFKNFNLDTIGGELLTNRDYSQVELKTDYELLDLARRYWDALSDFRSRRQMNRMYYRGDQWGETMEDPDAEGEYITEQEWIERQGKVPLKQNKIRQAVKNMIGQFLQNATKTTIVSHDRREAALCDILSNALRAVHKANKIDMLDARNFEEFLLSAMSVCKISYKYWKERNKEDVYIENCNPNRMFFNNDISDPRMHNLSLIGYIHDLSRDELVSAFAKNPQDEKRVLSPYTGTSREIVVNGYTLSSDEIDNLDFYITRDISKCRVLEIWYLKSAWRTYAHDWADGTKSIVPYSDEEINAMNQQRILMGAANGIPPEQVPLIETTKKYEQYWCVKFMSPNGHILLETETPYHHDSHPFVVVAYPLLDGEVWSFVEDILDQQRYINRLITLMDFIIGFSAKGVLLVPEDAIPKDMTPTDFASEWTKFNGVIVYKSKPGVNPPEQIVGNSINLGLNEMILMQLKMMEDISGVHNAIQGIQPKSGTPSRLYEQQIISSGVNNKDFISTFADFQQQRDMKILQLILQFYDDNMFVRIGGEAAQTDFDPDRIRNFDYEVVVAESQDTPVYRQLIDDLLFRLMEMQAIDLEMFLENTSLPFADKMLEQLKKRQQQALDPAAMQGQVPVDPQAAALIQQMIPKR